MGYKQTKHLFLLSSSGRGSSGIESLGSAVRDGDEHGWLVLAAVGAIDTEESFAFQLNHSALWEETHTGISQGLALHAGDGIDEVLEVLVVAQLGLGDEVVELHEQARDILRL